MRFELQAGKLLGETVLAGMWLNVTNVLLCLQLSCFPVAQTYFFCSVLPQAGPVPLIFL